MSTSHSPLENLHVASPCHASWDAMTGDDQTRFCKSCSKNVFNLSMMTRAQAENLIREKEGRLCVRYAQRADGTILTQDCPVGAAAPQMVNNSWHWLRAGVAVAIAALFSTLGAQAAESEKCVKTMGKPATSQSFVIKGEMAAKPAPAPAPVVVGEPAPPPPGGTHIVGAAVMTRPVPAPTPAPVSVIQGKMAEPLTHVMGAPPPPLPSQIMGRPVALKPAVKKPVKAVKPARKS